MAKSRIDPVHIPLGTALIERRCLWEMRAACQQLIHLGSAEINQFLNARLQPMV
jgi:hypothetical protein